MAEVVLFMNKSPSVVYWFWNNLYLNITNRCSNDCYFCFKKFKDGMQGFNLKLRSELSPNEIIEKLQECINIKNWSEVVFCGFGEPFERLYCVLEVTRWIKKCSGKIVRIDTNGQGCLLNKGRSIIKELKEAGVDKISVSLNAHEKETYNQICKPAFSDAFENVLGFIERAGKEFEVEITTVTIPEANIQKIREIARKLGVGFRIREYIPCFW
jgi:TatD family-associated radical SAM protein